MKKIFLLLSIFISLSVFGQTKEVKEISMLRSQADSLHSIGKSDSALIIGEKAIALSQKINDKVLLIGSLAGQGVYLRSVGRIEDALESYGKAMEIALSPEIRNNPSQEAIEESASLYINLSVLDLDMQHKEEAVANAIKAGDWTEKSKDTAFKATVFGVVGSVLTGCGDLKEASKFQSLAYSNAKATGDEEASFRAAAYAMLISDRSGEKHKAQEWREICRELLPNIESLMARLVYYQAECSISLKNNDKKGAFEWFDKIVNSEGIDNLPFVKFDAYNNMHIAYAGLGDYKNAYETLLKGNELRDTIWEREKAESLRELTVKYNTKETELALAQSEARRANTLMWLFAAIGALLIITVVFLLYMSRQRRRRMEKEIEYSNLRADLGRQLTEQYIEGLENERARMAKELHDGVCNDLLAVQMNIRNGHPEKETSELLDSCRESVRRISHELMPPEFSYANVDEVIRMFVYKQTEASKGKTKFFYESESEGADWLEIPDSMALDVYRIAQEAIGNAVKYSGATNIWVELILNKENLILTISDNGEFKEKGEKGLGIESMKKRAKSINGLLEISRKGNTEGEKNTEVKLIVRSWQKLKK